MSGRPSNGDRQQRARPPRWHEDPEDPTQWRYWDGQQWTEHRAPKAQPRPPRPITVQRYDVFGNRTSATNVDSGTTERFDSDQDNSQWPVLPSFSRWFFGLPVVWRIAVVFGPVLAVAAVVNVISGQDNEEPSTPDSIDRAEQVWRSLSNPEQVELCDAYFALGDSGAFNVLDASGVSREDTAAVVAVVGVRCEPFRN